MTGVLAVAATALVAAAPAASAATVQHLRFRTFTVPGATGTEIVAVNDKGTFVGAYTDSAGSHGFIQAGHHLTRFNYPGSADTIGSGVNDQGTVVGWYSSGAAARGFARSPGGHFTSLTDPLAGTGPDQGTFASGVNDQGVIVGDYVTSANIYHGFVYRSGRFTTVNVPKAYYDKPDWGSAIYDINDSGAMTGIYTPSKKNVLEGYVGTAGHFTSFIAPGAGTRPGDDTLPEGISNAGVIAGGSIGASGVYHGWLLSHGRYTLLNDPLAATDSAKGLPSGTLPADVNRQGLVVGLYFNSRHIEKGFIVQTGTGRLRASAPATAPYATPPAGAHPRPSSAGLIEPHGLLSGMQP